jgi:hypothetical protein
MGVRLVVSVEGSSTTQAHFNSAACGHVLRQEVDFSECDFFVVASRQHGAHRWATLHCEVLF